MLDTIYTSLGYQFKLHQIEKATGRFYALLLDNNGDLYATPFDFFAVVEIIRPDKSRAFDIVPITELILEQLTDISQTLDLVDYFSKYVRHIEKDYFDSVNATLTPVIPIYYEKKYSQLFSALNPVASAIISDLDSKFTQSLP